MNDLLGYRRLLGAVIPDYNTVVMPDFYRANLTGVTAHSSDYASTSADDRVSEIRIAIARMKTRAPISIALAIDELMYESGMARALRPGELGADTDPIYPDDAIRDALACFGSNIKVAVITSFSEDHHVAALEHLRSLDTYVVSGWHADFRDGRQASRISYVKMRELYDAAVAQGDPDLVLQLGHNMPMARLVSNLEEDHGRPILAVNSVLLWKMLRQAGIEDPIPGFGKLLFDF